VGAFVANGVGGRAAIEDICQSYTADFSVSELVASRDLKKLCDLGLFEPQGEKRGRFYRAGAELQAARAATRMPRVMADPYELVG